VHQTADQHRPDARTHVHTSTHAHAPVETSATA
jgi:hypothetical protein